MGNMLKKLLLSMGGFAATVAVWGGEALAQQYRAEPWQVWFQEPRSPTAERIWDFHNLVFAIEVAIVVFVLAILGYIIVRFNSKANPVPSKTTHNTALEIIWTVVPIIILVVIAVPSLKLLYFTDKAVNPEMTLKVTGNQWYWSYAYPDHDGISFDSLYVFPEDLEEGQPRMLTVDNPVVLPVDTDIRVLQNSNDVIHNWAVPALGLKLDTTPGRVNETWVRINDEGTYYGMCSELCGVNHGFMPIQIEAVSKEEFAAWVEEAKAEFASNDPAADTDETQVAAAQAQQ